MEIEAKERIIVGVNKYQVEENEYSDILKIDMKVQDEQIKFLNKIRAERNNSEVDKKLKALKKAAESTENLIPFIIDAVKEYASIGEICNTLRSVFGEYKERVTI
jgi:methylmalonyl-CoA mutase N-terminal domain/subunit